MAKRISQLTALTSASLDTTLLGIDRGISYKVELDVLADAVKDRINTLDDIRLDSLENFTSSFTASVASGTISGSSQLTSSFDQRYVVSGSITQTTWDNIANKPSGIVSQSTDLSSLNTFTASISTGSLVNRLNAIESVSGSWITESETGSFLTSLNGAISSSVQVLGGSGVYSSSAQIQGNIYSAGSSVTIQDLLIGAGTTFGKVTTDGSKYISVMPTYNVESARFWSNGNVTIQDAGDYVDNGFRLDVSGSTRIVGATTITGSILLSGSLVFPTQGTIKNGIIATPQVGSKITITDDGSGGLVGWNSQALSVAYNPILISTYPIGSTIVWQDGSTATITGWDDYGPTYIDLFWDTPKTGTLFPITLETSNYADAIEADTWTFDNSGSLITPGDIIVSGSLITTNGITGSTNFDTIVNKPTLISGSSQLTSSFDTRYTLSGSVVSGTTPSGTISGSAQITAFGFVSSSVSAPAGTISGSSQLTSSFDGRYTQTGSFNTLTASFNSFTASAQSVTTGSNSFNGTQTITGSLIITTGSFVASQILANTASLYLTSGSNMYVQNNGLVEITGSLNVSGTTTLKGAVNVGTGSGPEGGEIDLAYAQTGNTTLTGSAIIFDVYGDKIRIFEGGGTNRGGYFDISTLAAGVGTDLGKLTYFIEAYANVSYTLPGSYTNDVCRYSVVSNNVNVPTSWFNTSTYTFTPLKTGYWEIIASYDVYRNGEASLIIQKNGTSVAQAGSISSVVQQITKIIYMNGSTDYINIVNNGVNANARTQTSSNAFFQARYVGA